MLLKVVDEGVGFPFLILPRRALGDLIGFPLAADSLPTRREVRDGEAAPEKANAFANVVEKGYPSTFGCQTRASGRIF